MASKFNGLEALRLSTQPISGNDNNLYIQTLPINALVSDPWDHLVATTPTSTSEVYTYKFGGSGGTVVATITVVYTDATKSMISTVDKT